MKNLVTILLLLSCTVFGYSQDTVKKYYLEFSKEGKTKVLKEGKNIVFALLGDTIEKKGELKQITADSLVIHVKEKNKNTIYAYPIESFKVIAYIQPSSVAIGVTYFVAIAALTAVGGPQAIAAADFIEPIKFRQNINLDKGWTVKIIAYN